MLFRSGVVPVTATDLLLFYSAEGETRYVPTLEATDVRLIAFLMSPSHLDFSKATNKELEALAQACQPAAPGSDTENVDGTYHKVRKLDLANFATTLDIHASGIMNVVNGRLLQGRKQIRAERHSIYVYGAFYRVRLF